MSGSCEQRSAPSPRLSSVQGHGCADPDTVRAAVVPLDVAAIEDWTARNKAARTAYATRDAELDAKQLRSWKRFGRWPAPGEKGLPK